MAKRKSKKAKAKAEAMNKIRVKLEAANEIRRAKDRLLKSMGSSAAGSSPDLMALAERLSSTRHLLSMHVSGHNTANNFAFAKAALHGARIRLLGGGPGLHSHAIIWAWEWSDTDKSNQTGSGRIIINELVPAQTLPMYGPFTRAIAWTIEATRLIQLEPLVQALAAIDLYARDDIAFGLNLNGGLKVDGNMTEVVYSVELMSYVTTAGTQLLRKDGKWTLIPPKRDAQAAITKQVLTALREREGLASAAKEALQEAQQPPQECAESQAETTCVGRKRSAFVAGLVPSLFTVRAYFGSKFMAADVFKGRLDGFVFKSGQHGLGYYADSQLIAAPEAHPIDAAIASPAHRTTTGQGVRVRVPRDATLTHVVRKSCLANLLPFVEPSARHKQQTFIRSSVIQDALCSGTNDSVKDDASVAATPPICLLLDELGGYDGSILTRSEPLVNRMFMYNLGLFDEKSEMATKPAHLLLVYALLLNDSQAAHGVVDAVMGVDCGLWTCGDLVSRIFVTKEDTEAAAVQSTKHSKRVQVVTPKSVSRTVDGHKVLDHVHVGCAVRCSRDSRSGEPVYGKVVAVHRAIPQKYELLYDDGDTEIRQLGDGSFDLLAPPSVSGRCLRSAGSSTQSTCEEQMDADVSLLLALGHSALGLLDRGYSRLELLLAGCSEDDLTPRVAVETLVAPPFITMVELLICLRELVDMRVRTIRRAAIQIQRVVLARDAKLEERRNAILKLARDVRIADPAYVRNPYIDSQCDVCGLLTSRAQRRAADGTLAYAEQQLCSRCPNYSRCATCFETPLTQRLSGEHKCIECTRGTGNTKKDPRDALTSFPTQEIPELDKSTGEFVATKRYGVFVSPKDDNRKARAIMAWTIDAEVLRSDTGILVYFTAFITHWCAMAAEFAVKDRRGAWQIHLGRVGKMSDNILIAFYMISSVAIPTFVAANEPFSILALIACSGATVIFSQKVLDAIHPRGATWVHHEITEEAAQKMKPHRKRGIYRETAAIGVQLSEELEGASPTLKKWQCAAMGRHLRFDDNENILWTTCTLFLVQWAATMCTAVKTMADALKSEDLSLKECAIKSINAFRKAAQRASTVPHATVNEAVAAMVEASRSTHRHVLWLLSAVTEPFAIMLGPHIDSSDSPVQVNAVLTSIMWTHFLETLLSYVGIACFYNPALVTAVVACNCEVDEEWRNRDVSRHLGLLKLPTSILSDIAAYPRSESQLQNLRESNKVVCIRLEPQRIVKPPKGAPSHASFFGILSFNQFTSFYHWVDPPRPDGTIAFYFVMITHILLYRLTLIFYATKWAVEASRDLGEQGAAHPAIVRPPSKSVAREYKEKAHKLGRLHERYLPGLSSKEKKKNRIANFDAFALRQRTTTSWGAVLYKGSSAPPSSTDKKGANAPPSSTDKKGANAPPSSTDKKGANAPPSSSDQTGSNAPPRTYDKSLSFKTPDGSSCSRMCDLYGFLADFGGFLVERLFMQAVGTHMQLYTQLGFEGAVKALSKEGMSTELDEAFFIACCDIWDNWMKTCSNGFIPSPYYYMEPRLACQEKSSLFTSNDTRTDMIAARANVGYVSTQVNFGLFATLLQEADLFRWRSEQTRSDFIDKADQLGQTILNAKTKSAYRQREQRLQFKAGGSYPNKGGLFGEGIKALGSDTDKVSRSILTGTYKANLEGMVARRGCGDVIGLQWARETQLLHPNAGAAFIKGPSKDEYAIGDGPALRIMPYIQGGEALSAAAQRAAAVALLTMAMPLLPQTCENIWKAKRIEAPLAAVAPKLDAFIKAETIDQDPTWQVMENGACEWGKLLAARERWRQLSSGLTKGLQDLLKGAYRPYTKYSAQVQSLIGRWPLTGPAIRSGPSGQVRGRWSVVPQAPCF